MKYICIWNINKVQNFARAINRTGRIFYACASACESDRTRLLTWPDFRQKNGTVISRDYSFKLFLTHWLTGILWTKANCSDWHCLFISDFRFGLFEAMSAIEIMDPKMDAGMVCNRKRKVLQFAEVVEVIVFMSALKFPSRAFYFKYNKFIKNITSQNVWNWQFVLQASLSSVLQIQIQTRNEWKCSSTIVIPLNSMLYEHIELYSMLYEHIELYVINVSYVSL